MKILVRLPNWLGDMVMSIGFINALRSCYPEAKISVIAKKGIHGMLDYFPPLDQQFIFSKEDYPGTFGAWRFGRMIRRTAKFDLFFSLPDSFSSALIGFASGARERVGYEKELRSVLLTRKFRKPQHLHRVEEYISLLEQYTGGKVKPEQILLSNAAAAKSNDIIVNINSEASSRRLPLQKAVNLVSVLQENLNANLVMIGGRSDQPFVEEVIRQLPNQQKIVNKAGKTTLQELVELMASSRIVLTTDSGPAHVANAAGTPTVVLFGAGNEKNTAPFNKLNRTIIRLGQLPCEPCVKNVCVLYGTPKCLELLDEQRIIKAISELGF